MRALEAGLTADSAVGAAGRAGVLPALPATGPGSDYAQLSRTVERDRAAPAAGFLRRQVLTSRNIRGSLFTDFALGGLNYQIEHHLFPSTPRPSLRHAQAPLRAFCAQRGIPYSETGVLASYAQVLRHSVPLAGQPTRNPVADTAATGPGAP
jgi:hypothetical protein